MLAETTQYQKPIRMYTNNHKNIKNNFTPCQYQASTKPCLAMPGHASTKPCLAMRCHAWPMPGHASTKPCLAMRRHATPCQYQAMHGHARPCDAMRAPLLVVSGRASDHPRPRFLKEQVPVPNICEHIFFSGHTPPPTKNQKRARQTPSQTYFFRANVC